MSHRAEKGARSVVVLANHLCLCLSCVAYCCVVLLCANNGDKMGAKFVTEAVPSQMLRCPRGVIATRTLCAKAVHTQQQGPSPSHCLSHSTYGKGCVLCSGHWLRVLGVTYTHTHTHTHTHTPLRPRHCIAQGICCQGFSDMVTHTRARYLSAGAVGFRQSACSLCPCQYRSPCAATETLVHLRSVPFRHTRRHRPA